MEDLNIERVGGALIRSAWVLRISIAILSIESDIQNLSFYIDPMRYSTQINFGHIIFAALNGVTSFQ